MRFQTIRRACAVSTCIAAIVAATPAFAADADAADADASGDAIIVTGARTTYNNSAVTEQMIATQPPVASVTDLVDTLPGVQVQQGDAFGFDDWSTTISIRGFQTNLDQQQVGITIDGLPNGGSSYGGGSKANRFIDTQNIGTVVVSQGTADIGSLSNEALGGTLDFVTSDPLDEMRVRLSGSLGDFQASRYYGRFDTGTFLGGSAKAWISYSHQEATDWINGSAQNHRDHFAGKFIIDSPVKLTGYAAYDEAHEDNYDQVFSALQYQMVPDQDGLVGVWTGIPYQDQAYRRAWSTLRKNFFGYLKADATIANALDLHASVYYHDMAGRGDWVPQYVVDVTNDGPGNPQSELAGTRTVQGGSPLGRIYFVDANGVSLTPTAGCVGSIPYPYGGTTDPNYDPACYAPGAIGAQSYRHTHYRKDRTGGTVDASWKANLGGIENTLRGGLWYEDTNRQEWRDWHNVTDTTVGPAYDNVPYWTQYSRKYPQDTFKWYVQDTVTFGPVTANFGAKQFINHIDRIDQFGQTPDAGFKSTSDVLLSGGIQFEPITGLNVFAGYAENFKALSDSVLEFSNADLTELQPETAENWEAGVRYESRVFNASATWFKSKFSNQVIFVSNNTSAGPDYLGEGDGKFFNAGGIDSEGFELLANIRPVAGLNLYGAYTYIDATYRGTGNAALDLEQGVTPGNVVTGIPKHMWVLAGSYNYGPVTLGLTGKYTGDRFVNAGNTWTADNYFLTDLNVSVKGEALTNWLQDLDFTLTINNLTDEDYLGGISGGGAWIGAPRTMMFSVTADF
jgi:Outer membrane receptor proteins, mostly Fe transport